MLQLRIVGVLWFVLASVACHGSHAALPSGNGDMSTNVAPRDAGNLPPTDDGPSPDPTVVVPPAAVTADPTTSTLTLPAATALGDVKYVPNRSSAKLFVPVVANARDYRVFAVKTGVASRVVATGREHLDGATIFCAGLRQRNQCNNDAQFPVSFHNDEIDLPSCPDNGHAPSVAAVVNRTIELNGIGADETIVVEALDRACPFAGVLGPVHADISTATAEMAPMVDVTTDKAYTILRWQPTFPIRTADEIRAQYGSLIMNGQGWQAANLTASPPESPLLHMGQPAPADDPVVLARAIVKVSATGTATLPEGFGDGDYFDDFSDDTDQPKLLRTTGNLPDYFESAIPPTHIDLYQNKKWNWYSTGMAGPPDDKGVWNAIAQAFISDGVLHTNLSDFYLDAMSSISMYPRRVVQLPTAADKYLHVTLEVPTAETSRRYFNLAFCGSDTVGKTYNGETPVTAPIPRPAFMNDDAISRSNPLGWNCLYLVPRGEGYYAVDGGDIAGTHADTSLKITVMPTVPAPTTDTEYQSTSPPDGLALQFGPSQDASFPRQWERQVGSDGKPSGPWLDDVYDVFSRVKLDVFVRRDRVVIYVNGEQRICADLSAKPLTMAEVALGFWQVLYHTSAEFLEMRGHEDWANPQTGAAHIIHNTPFIDTRVWDNVGFREDVSAPIDFDATRCQ